jgi:hypothetical protein
MSNISELIKKQAAAVIGQSNNIKAAEKLEEAARLLRGDTTSNEKKIAKFLSDRKQNKASARERFASAIHQNRIDKVESILKEKDWHFKIKTSNERVYTNLNHPGATLKITDEHFTLLKNGIEIKPKTHLIQLSEYLKHLTKL